MFRICNFSIYVLLKNICIKEFLFNKYLYVYLIKNIFNLIFNITLNKLTM